jgi:hypothetical protein
LDGIGAAFPLFAEGIGGSIVIFTLGGAVPPNGLLFSCSAGGTVVVGAVSGASDLISGAGVAGGLSGGTDAVGIGAVSIPILGAVTGGSDMLSGGETGFSALTGAVTGAVAGSETVGFSAGFLAGTVTVDVSGTGCVGNSVCG